MGSFFIVLPAVFRMYSLAILYFEDDVLQQDGGVSAGYQQLRYRNLYAAGVHRPYIIDQAFPLTCDMNRLCARSGIGDGSSDIRCFEYGAVSCGTAADQPEGVGRCRAGWPGSGIFPGMWGGRWLTSDEQQ